MPKVVLIRPDTAECALRCLKIDEYGEIKRRLALCEPDEQRLKVLKEEIEDWHADFDGDLPIKIQGGAYEIQLSPMRNERTVVDKKALFMAMKRALTLDGLIALLSFNMSLVDDNIPKSAQGAFIVKERSGYRTFNVVALNAATPKAA